MNFIINSFFNSVYFNNLNFFIAKKILKIFKIFFIQTSLKDLPNKNYIINENQILKEFEDGKRFLISKPYITYSHLIDLMTVMNRKSLSFFDYGAGNLNLYFYLSNKFSPKIKASGNPLGFVCSAYLILIPKLFFSGKIFLNWFS